MKAAGYDVTLHVFPAGEERQKSFVHRHRHAGGLRPVGLTRTDFAVAFGGGVTRDMAGFAAPPLTCVGFRLSRFLHLLAQVDSSVGGSKRGSSSGKTWWAPSGSRLVLIDRHIKHSAAPLLRRRQRAGGQIRMHRSRASVSRQPLRDGQAWERLEDIIYQCM